MTCCVSIPSNISSVFHYNNFHRVLQLSQGRTMIGQHIATHTTTIHFDWEMARSQMRTCLWHVTIISCLTCRYILIIISLVESIWSFFVRVIVGTQFLCECGGRSYIGIVLYRKLRRVAFVKVS